MSDDPAPAIEISFDAAIDLCGYHDIAPGKRCAQSSLSRHSLPGGAAALVDPPLKPGFAIHTETERNPWWSIDLGAGYRDLIVFVYNRATGTATAAAAVHRRALPLVVQVSEDGVRWTTLADVTQEFGDVASATPLAIRLRCAAGQPPIRCVRFYVRHRRAVLHLQLVRVFAPLDEPGEATPPARVETDMVRAFHDRVAPSIDFDVARRGFERDRLSFLPGTDVGAPGAVLVTPAGRLGNRIIGAMGAILFAEERGVGRVWLNFEDHKPGFALPERLRYRGIDLMVRLPAEGEEPSLMMSAFQYGRYVGEALQHDTARLTTILREAIRPILMAGIAEGALDAGTVVVHIRSGDLFAVDGRGRHAGYVQPPLAYYRACLEHAATQHPLTAVILVHEDRNNPCVDALAAHLAASGIPCTLQSGTLRQDTATIFAARRIITGYGTFAVALAALSAKVEAVYAFRRLNLAHLFDAGAVRIFIAHDTAGGFTAYGSWSNTAEQRQLMLDYPQANLKIRPWGQRY